jgi:hypothetical protein
MTAIVAVGLVICFLIIRARQAPWVLVGFGMVIGMVILALYAPAVFGTGLIALILTAAVVVLFDFARKAWLWSRRNG